MTACETADDRREDMLTRPQFLAGLRSVLPARAGGKRCGTMYTDPFPISSSTAAAAEKKYRWASV